MPSQWPVGVDRNGVLRLAGLARETKGDAIVARERPTASNVVRPNESLLERAWVVGDPLGLTRAEAHAAAAPACSL